MLIKRKVRFVSPFPVVLWLSTGFKSMSGIILKGKISKGNHTDSSRLIGFLVILWWSSAICGTKLTQIITSSFPFPLTLKIIHLLVWCAIDWLILRNREAGFVIRASTCRRCALKGIFFICATTITYVADWFVPMSLAHTMNSCGALFSVMTTILWFGQRVPWSEILSLIPLALGVIMSSVTDLEYNYLAFGIAFMATLLTVMHNTSGKILMILQNIEPIVLHFYAGIIAVLGLCASALIFEVGNIIDKSANFAEQWTKRRATLLSYAASTSDQSEFPLLFVILSSMICYIQSITSLLVLERIPTISYNVINTFKNFLGILMWSLYFPSNVRLENVVGVLIAWMGFISYAYQRLKSNRRIEKENKT